MKHSAILLLAGSMLAVSACNAQEVKIKKGKATMDEVYYNELRTKAEAYDRFMAAPASFNDSASYAIGRDIFKQWIYRILVERRHLRHLRGGRRIRRVHYKRFRCSLPLQV